MFKMDEAAQGLQYQSCSHSHVNNLGGATSSSGNDCHRVCRPQDHLSLSPERLLC